MQSTVERPMAKKLRGRPSIGRDDVTIRIDRKLAGMVRFVAGRKGLSSAQVLGEILKAPLTRLYSEIARDLETEIRGSDIERE
jgi:hypothetical protein